MATVVLLGTLDTKGAEYDFLRERLREAGVETVLVDAGILGEPKAEPDVSKGEVARAADADVGELAEKGDRGAAVAAMASGSSRRAIRLPAHPSKQSSHGWRRHHAAMASAPEARTTVRGARGRQPLDGSVRAAAAADGGCADDRLAGHRDLHVFDQASARDP